MLKLEVSRTPPSRIPPLRSRTSPRSTRTGVPFQALDADPARGQARRGVREDRWGRRRRAQVPLPRPLRRSLGRGRERGAPEGGGRCVDGGERGLEAEAGRRGARLTSVCSRPLSLTPAPMIPSNCRVIEKRPGSLTAKGPPLCEKLSAFPGPATSRKVSRRFPGWTASGLMPP